jgi:hypothetical protein
MRKAEAGEKGAKARRFIKNLYNLHNGNPINGPRFVEIEDYLQVLELNLKTPAAGAILK